MSTIRWSPPLPSIGRAGPRIQVTHGSPLLKNLEEFYVSRRSVSDMFECRISPAFQCRSGLPRGEPRYLSEFSPAEQSRIILKALYFKASAHFVRKLRSLLFGGHLNRVRSWFHTANAAVIPYIITVGTDYEVIDHLTRWSMENCANNYADFQRDWKTLKKNLRKEFANGQTAKFPPYMGTYCRYFRQAASRDFSSPEEWGRFVLLWTQTRATGLADSVMAERSTEKFLETISGEPESIHLNQDTLLSCCLGTYNVQGRRAHLSVGVTACLEKTRQDGGKTGMLKHITRHRVLRREYNFEDLTFREIPPRACRSANDVLSWAVQEAHLKPTYVRTVRTHTVMEPSKARVITVAPFSYQVIMGVFAHMFQATLVSRGVRAGLHADRHLWRFLREQLNPQDTHWENLSGGTVYALSTDLSEATDFGNLSVSRQVWDVYIRISSMVAGFPTALAVLAKTLYQGKRFIFTPHKGGKYSLTVRKRAWFMGDMMTKVILTTVHDYSCRMSGLKVYSLVGDDEISLSNNPLELERHLTTLSRVGFKVSEADTFVSKTLMFYCEEGSTVPQRPSDSTHVQMRRGQELTYLDYPRIRLLLSVSSETDSYSMTNVGRFSLLGKETRWVHAVNPNAEYYFILAGLLQHIIVPQDSDCHCPYTPIEVGGDGAFPHTGSFLRQVVADKSRNYEETVYRLQSLYEGTFSHKLVRSARLDRVVHKHHLLVPKIESLRKVLPPEAIIDPVDDQARVMLNSLRLDDIEPPSKTFVRLCRSFYYKELMMGIEPTEPHFEVSRSFGGGSNDEHGIDFHDFLETWCNPGFRFRNMEPYWVRRDLVDMGDPMSFGWDFRLNQNQYPSQFRIWSDFIKREVSLMDSSMEDVIKFITHKCPLPERMMKRLNLFMESDSYILQTLPRENIPKFFGIVTRDTKLCDQVCRVLDARDRDVTHEVICLDPSIYLIGRTDEIVGRNIDETPWGRQIPDGIVWVEDPGAMLHVDYTEFQDGFALDEQVWEYPIGVWRHQRMKCVVARFLKSTPV